MKDKIESLLKSYSEWLKKKMSITEIDGGYFEITTPYLDRRNDHLQIYLKEVDGGFELTDDGYIISDLKMSGCSISDKRKQILDSTIAGFGIKLDGDSLVVKCKEGNFPFKKHSLIQAMLAINDMFYLASPHVSNLFFEDVENWMGDEGVRFVKASKYSGKAGYDHLFDFVIPKSRSAPERFVQVVNTPKKDTAENLAFKWFDIVNSRPPGAIMLPIINDSDSKPPEVVIEIMRNYEMKPILWSKKEDSVELLVA